MAIQFIIYTIIALILSAVDFHFAFKAFRKPEKVGKALGWSALFAGIIALAYLLSVHFQNALLVSICSSVTFAGIDCMLVSLAYYTFLVTGVNGRRGSRAVSDTIRVFASLDIVALLLNIFTGAVVAYAPLDPVGISYQMKTPYVLHLGFTYFMVAISLAALIYKSARTPRQYRNQYLMILVAIGVMVALNAVFLFQDRDSFFTKVDCSILGYSLGLYLMYWTAYDYRENDMLSSLSKIVVENVDQGVVLFDYMDELIMYNPRAEALLKGVEFRREMPRTAFLEACGIAHDGADRFTAQCDIGNLPLRCDFRRIKDRRDGDIGSVYTFTDLSRDTDLTTGFAYAKDGRYLRENADRFAAPTTVVVFDIIGLRDVNRVLGRDEGDRRIRALAKTMRLRMPPEATLLRGYEAYLIALCPGAREDDLRPRVEAIARGGDSTVMYGMCTADGGPLEEALKTAYRSIQVKKLMSPCSTRSQALASLVRALKEADADTEDHVQRTQKMGALLGARIGLKDAEMAELQLLCLLHDIGKIGIPLEILNKPGKLADQEWAVLRTHPEKGYQIAMSSNELKCIAEMVRYHHERWDGKGYPTGLAGEDIPVLSRIISVVDAYDAMVNDRSYRKAMKPEQAQEEIRQNAGTQFDPGLAAEFLQMLAENPELAKGEKVAASEAREQPGFDFQPAETGFTSPIAYSRYMLNMESVIVEVDDRFEELTGYTAAEVLGNMNQIDLIPPEDRGYYMLQAGKQFAHGDIAYLRHEILRKDGERIQVACYGRRYFDSAVKGFKNEIIIFRL